MHETVYGAEVELVSAGFYDKETVLSRIAISKPRLRTASLALDFPEVIGPPWHEVSRTNPSRDLNFRIRSFVAVFANQRICNLSGTISSPSMPETVVNESHIFLDTTPSPR
jgi:hypothetical protein